MFASKKGTPPKIKGWNIIPWRSGSDHFPFFSWVICRFHPLIFQGVGTWSKHLRSQGIWKTTENWMGRTWFASILSEGKSWKMCELWTFFSDYLPHMILIWATTKKTSWLFAVYNGLFMVLPSNIGEAVFHGSCQPRFLLPFLACFPCYIGNSCWSPFKKLPSPKKVT